MTVSAATCTEDGASTYVCANCGDSYVETTPALGHDYVTEVTEASCESDGYTTHTCARCGETYTDDATPALGHDYVTEVTEASCESDGYTTHTCARCGETYTDDATPALGHDYACTEDGDDLIYTCTRCGDSYTEARIETVTVQLTVGERYTFRTGDATVTSDIDTGVASMTVDAIDSGYQQVTSLSEGSYLLVCSGSVLTPNAATYYSSWDGAGTVNGLSCTTFRTTGNYDAYLWTITAVSGGYTIQSADGQYLNLTAGTRSSNLSLSANPQIITIDDLGSSFTVRYGSTYLDRYSASFVASYPGSANENEQWTLYRAETAGYDVTFTGVAEGVTRPVIGGVRYEITVHAHHYTGETTPATCTEDGETVYTCDCGDSYTETIPATGHDYSRVEIDGSYVYTCAVCGDSYTEPMVSTTYDTVSALSSGNRYVITVYAYGSYYALTHNGTTLGVQAITVSDGQVTSEVTDEMLWSYANSRFSFTENGTTYYLARSGYSSLTISYSGTSVLLPQQPAGSRQLLPALFQRTLLPEQI